MQRHLLAFFIFILLFVILPAGGFCQLVVLPGSTGAALVGRLIGAGVTVSNISYTGAINSRGIFSNGNTTNIGFRSGIILSTGKVQNAAGLYTVIPNTNNGTAGDPLLSLVARQVTNDAAILEFDFIPVSDTIRFRYVFASEEYPAYVGQYNDVFGFFISGPNPVGGNYADSNVAIIPGTSKFVTINNINNGTANKGPCVNCKYYINNTSSTITYNGFTVPLTALIRVVPCRTYHIRIAIADAVDNSYDSGVFLEENSFSSNTISTSTNFSLPGIPSGAVEGCNNATITFSLPSPKSKGYTLHYTVGGTAKNGIDYLKIPDSIVIPPNSISSTLDIVPLMDTISEPTETVVLKYQNVLCSTVTTDSVYVVIYNKKPFQLISSPDKAICYGFSDSIFAKGTGGVAPYQYIWSDITTDTFCRIVYPGVSQSFYIRVKDMCNTEITDTLHVTVNPRPVASFQSDSVQCFKNNNFLFNNNSAVNPLRALTYNWDFGDGSASLLADPRHSYSGTGRYKVSLVAISSDGCRDSVNHSVSIDYSPGASFSVNQASQCMKNNNFIFSNTSATGSGILTYLWSFGDGNTSVLKDPAHSYTNPDTFDVRLRAVSDKGCEDTFSSKIFTRPMPSAKFTVNDSDQCLTGNLFSFTNRSQIRYGSFSGKWDFGDAVFSTHPNPDHTYSGHGIYKAGLTTVSDFGCRDSVYHDVTVNPMPSADFQVIDSSQCLKNNSFVFSDFSSIQSGNITLHNWNFGDGGISTDPDPVHSYSLSSDYQVNLSVTSNKGCKDSVTKTMKVFPMPVANFSQDKSCLDNQTHFTDLSTIVKPASIYQWQWNFGDGNTSLLQNPTHVYTTPGLFQVVLQVISNDGCASIANSQVKVNPNVPANVLVNATVNDDLSISVNWEPVSTGIPKYYTLERAEDDLNFISMGNFNLSYTGYIDRGVFVNEHKYTYRTRVVDSCDYQSPYSNIGRTMLLNAFNMADNPHLIWTGYHEWNSGVSHYQVEIFDEAKKMFAPVGISENDTAFVDNTEKLNQNEFCYRVAAIGKNGQESRSNVVCVPTSLSLWVPSAFSPNGDTINSFFTIKSNFVRSFHIDIFNRWGEKVFSSENINLSWDGKAGGYECPAGEYFYRLVARGTKGQQIDKQGTVLLIR